MSSQFNVFFGGVPGTSTACAVNVVALAIAIFLSQQLRAQGRADAIAAGETDRLPEPGKPAGDSESD